MAWSAGTFTRTNGDNTGSSLWQQDEADGDNIESSRHDTHDQDLATGINTCLTKDGQNSPSAHLSWVNTENYAAGGGTANAHTVSLPNTPTYYTGLTIRWKAGATNTGSATLNVSSLGVKTIKTMDGRSLQAGHVKSGSIFISVYDGTDFLLINPCRDLVDFTPSYGASGSMTYTSITTSIAQYAVQGNVCIGFVDASGTVGGTPSNNLYFVEPVGASSAQQNAAQGVGGGYMQNEAAFCFINSTGLQSANYDNTNLTAGTANLSVTFRYEIA